MRIMNPTILISCFIIFTFGGCTKITQTSVGDPIPVIRLVKIEPLSVKQFKDSLKITFSYEDGDGDLGNINADINSLEIKDNRLSKPDMYYIAPLSPNGSVVHIKGELLFKLRNLFLLGTSNTEKTTLELRIQDRAGHWSNKIITPEITITK